MYKKAVLIFDEENCNIARVLNWFESHYDAFRVTNRFSHERYVSVELDVPYFGPSHVWYNGRKTRIEDVISNLLKVDFVGTFWYDYRAVRSSRGRRCSPELVRFLTKLRNTLSHEESIWIELL